MPGLPLHTFLSHCVRNIHVCRIQRQISICQWFATHSHKMALYPNAYGKGMEDNFLYAHVKSFEYIFDFHRIFICNFFCKNLPPMIAILFYKPSDHFRSQSNIFITFITLRRIEGGSKNLITRVNERVIWWADLRWIFDCDFIKHCLKRKYIPMSPMNTIDFWSMSVQTIV